jgi:hypothetical protein
MLSLERAEPSSPAFSLRFERGRGHLVLARSFDITAEDRRGGARAFGRIVDLDLDLGPVRGGLRVKGGWSSLRTQRTELVSAVLEVDSPWSNEARRGQDASCVNVGVAQAG